MLILFKSGVKKQLKNVPKHIEEKFWSLVKEMKKNPIPARKFDIEKLKGYEHTYRVRLGGYRVIYELRVKEGKIIIHAILSRERAYKKSVR